MYKFITHNSLAVLLLLATVLVFLLHPLALQGRGGEHGGGDDVVVHLRGVAGRKLLVPLLGLLLVVQQPSSQQDSSRELFGTRLAPVGCKTCNILCSSAGGSRNILGRVKGNPADSVP